MRLRPIQPVPRNPKRNMSGDNDGFDEIAWAVLGGLQRLVDPIERVAVGDQHSGVDQAIVDRGTASLTP